MIRTPARLQPIGFWSYATQDDMASGGRLSKLRSMLMNELQQQYGRNPIKIFQDVAAIPPGAEWDEEIKNALTQATFLIPIITPAFIESDYCAQEVRVFLDTEKAIWERYPALSGVRRVFPIYYRPIDDIEPVDHDLLVELRRVQWVNFLDLRNKSDQAEEVQLTLDRLASSICKLLLSKFEDPAPGEGAAPAAQEPPTAPAAAGPEQRTATPRSGAAVEAPPVQQPKATSQPTSNQAAAQSVGSSAQDAPRPTLDPGKLPLALSLGAVVFVLAKWLLLILGLQGYISASVMLGALPAYVIELLALAAPVFLIAKRRDWQWYDRARVYAFGYGMTAVISGLFMLLGGAGGQAVVFAFLHGIPGLMAAAVFQQIAARPGRSAR